MNGRVSAVLAGVLAAVAVTACSSGSSGAASTASHTPAASASISSALIPATAATATVHVFNDGVIFTFNNASTGNMKAYQEGGFNLLATATIPALAGPSQFHTIRGIAIDAGAAYIATGGDLASGSSAAGQLVKVDLATMKQVYAVSESYGNDQLAAADGYVYFPGGEGQTNTVWQVLKESDGSKVGTLTGPTGGPHNTIALDKSGTTHVYLGGRCINTSSCAQSMLGQGTGPAGTPVLKDNGPNVGPGPGSGGIRPFTVGRGLTRVWETWTRYRGFSIGDLTTGKILASVNFGSYSGTSSAPSHGISVNPANTEVYVLDGPSNQVRVYTASDTPTLLAKINLPAWWGGTESSTYASYDKAKVGWVQHTMDGKYVLIGDAGAVVNTATRTLVTLPTAFHTDLFNSRHGWACTEWNNGTFVSGSHVGIGS